MKYLFFFIGSLLLFSACEQEALLSYNDQKPVVEAYLFAGKGIDSLRVTLPQSVSDTTGIVPTLDGKTIMISDGTREAILESIGDGYYQALDYTINAGNSYSLSFEHEGLTISAETFVPEKIEATISESEIFMEKIEAGTFPPNIGTVPDPIELEWANEEANYFYVVVQNTESNPEYINEFLNNPDFPARGFRTVSEPQIMDFYALNTRRDIQLFGKHNIIVFRVNPEYAALYATSGTTSTTINQPPTNIENGLGIFTGVSSDTLVLNVKKI